MREGQSPVDRTKAKYLSPRAEGWGGGIKRDTSTMNVLLTDLRHRAQSGDSPERHAASNPIMLAERVAVVNARDVSHASAKLTTWNALRRECLSKIRREAAVHHG